MKRTGFKRKPSSNFKAARNRVRMKYQKHGAIGYTFNRKMIARTHQRCGYTCVICGWPSPMFLLHGQLEAAHLVPLQGFTRYDPAQPRNHSPNRVSLCSTHHREETNNRWHFRDVMPERWAAAIKYLRSKGCWVTA